MVDVRDCPVCDRMMVELGDLPLNWGTVQHANRMKVALGLLPLNLGTVQLHHG